MLVIIVFVVMNCSFSLLGLNISSGYQLYIGVSIVYFQVWFVCYCWRLYIIDNGYCSFLGVVIDCGDGSLLTLARGCYWYTMLLKFIDRPSKLGIVIDCCHVLLMTVGISCYCPFLGVVFGIHDFYFSYCNIFLLLLTMNFHCLFLGVVIKDCFGSY